MGIDALAGTVDGDIMFGRIINGEGERYTIVPQRQRASVWYDQELEWVAPPKMAIRMF